MGKSLFIAEKPSVAQEFAKALGQSMTRCDGYVESDSAVVTWCVGHLVTMSYPEVYDPKYKKWSLDTLPFLPDHFLYEIIPSSKKQFGVVKKQLLRSDVDRIYICTDSGREGEYIYRLVAQEAGVKDKEQLRVWIDSQTEEEIKRGIREAKPDSAYDDLAAAAYLRAKEDYLMGINFSRVLTLKYGNSMASYLQQRYCVVSVGRVMTCVLGMVVRREWEIRNFRETPFYRVIGKMESAGEMFDAEWRDAEGSRWFASPKLYKENGFKKREDAEELIRYLTGGQGRIEARVVSIEKKKEKKNPPLLFNLAELQNTCSRMFHISPDETLKIVQDLYEKKLVTYPRTDARVLSSAIAKEISKNIQGLTRFEAAAPFAQGALDGGLWKTIGKTRYTNDAQITDHYALIPTGQGLGALKSLSSTAYGVYCVIVKRFLGIFYPPAVYRKISLVLECGEGGVLPAAGESGAAAQTEKFFASLRMLEEEGYLAVMKKKSLSQESSADPVGSGTVKDSSKEGTSDADAAGEVTVDDRPLLESLSKLRKGSLVPVASFEIRDGKTSPPKRYNSGSMILAMENAGQLIEDEELRSQIKSSGIGTSATRAEILKKLVTIGYLNLNQKTQILTPSLLGEMVFDVVSSSIRSLLNPELTASWEKGLTYVTEGTISEEEYMEKLSSFIVKWTEAVKSMNNQTSLLALYEKSAPFYQGRAAETGRTERYRKKSYSGKSYSAGGRRRTSPKKETES